MKIAIDLEIEIDFFFFFVFNSILSYSFMNTFYGREFATLLLREHTRRASYFGTASADLLNARRVRASLRHGLLPL